VPSFLTFSCVTFVAFSAAFDLLVFAGRDSGSGEAEPEEEEDAEEEPEAMKSKEKTKV
jgi:hypothetical protein